MRNEGDVAKFVQKMNIVTLQTNNFVPRTCEYYLHFNVNLPYPETEYNNCQIKKENLLKANNFNK